MCCWYLFRMLRILTSRLTSRMREASVRTAISSPSTANTVVRTRSGTLQKLDATLTSRSPSPAHAVLASCALSPTSNSISSSTRTPSRFLTFLQLIKCTLTCDSLIFLLMFCDCIFSRCCVSCVTTARSGRREKIFFPNTSRVSTPNRKLT